MIWAVLAVVLAYLLGALPGGWVLGRVVAVDLREHGSGNVGATNAVRARGPLFGLAVFVFDAGKGAAAAGLLPLLAPHWTWVPVACAGAAIVGHVFPVWFGFRGGKGFATALGAIVVLSLLAVAPIAATWVLLLVLTGYVSAATLGAAIVYPVFVYFVWGVGSPALLAFSCVLAAFLFYTHRSNLGRLARGQEHRFQRVWLPGRIIRRCDRRGGRGA